MLKIFNRGAGPSHSPANPSNSKRSASRNIATPPMTPPSLPSSPLDEKVEFEKVKVEIIPDNIISLIPNTAARMTEQLDYAVDEIRDLYHRSPAPEDFRKHERELRSARKLLQQIRYQTGFHTLEVAVALRTLQAVVKRLTVSVHSAQLVSNVMEELASARTNLVCSLRVNLHEATENDCEGGIQFNAKFGAAMSENGAPEVIIASGNKAKNGFQVNAPVDVQGNPDAFVRLAELYKRG